MKLTQNEIEVMEVLWIEKRPLPSTDIIKLSMDKTWKESSIYILINSLLKKGAIREAGFVRIGKGYARTFEPTESGERYYADLLASIASKTSVTTLFSTLFNNNNLTKETILQLEELLEAKKKELK